MSKERNVPSLLLRVQSMASSFTTAEKRVADFILQNPGDVLRFSVSDLATNSKTSDATVIRFIRKMGMSSYHELSVLLAQSMVSPVKMLNSDIDTDDPINSVIQKVFDGISNTISMTKDISQYAEFEAASDMLYNASRIFLLGFGNSSSVVSDFQQKLLRLRRPVTVQFDPHLLLIDIVNYARPTDVCFAISHSGRSKLVIDAVKMLRARDVKIISLSDICDSPLKNYSDLALSTMSMETKYNLYAASSKIAQYAIIDVLYTIMAYKHSDDALDAFENVNSSMRTYKC